VKWFTPKIETIHWQWNFFTFRKTMKITFLKASETIHGFYLDSETIHFEEWNDSLLEKTSKNYNF